MSESKFKKRDAHNDEPPYNINCCPPFYYTSCDYVGPKQYELIFMCLHTRAVHLKVATDFSAIEFIQTLRRVFSYVDILLRSVGLSLWVHYRTASDHPRSPVEVYYPGEPHWNGCTKALIMKGCKFALKRAVNMFHPFHEHHVKNRENENR